MLYGFSISFILSLGLRLWLSKELKIGLSSLFKCLSTFVDKDGNNMGIILIVYRIE